MEATEQIRIHTITIINSFLNVPVTYFSSRAAVFRVFCGPFFCF